MAKTTITGWSLETHSEFMKKLDGPRKRFYPAQRMTLKQELSSALGYKRDFRKEAHETMKQWMGRESEW